MVNRGSQYLPGPGGGGKIPSGTAPALPKPKTAPQSGKAGKFPAPVNGSVTPLRSNGKAGGAPAVNSAMKPVTSIKPFPLRSGK